LTENDVFDDDNRTCLGLKTSFKIDTFKRFISSFMLQNVTIWFPGRHFL